MTDGEAMYLESIARSAYNHTQVSLRANLFDKNDLTKNQIEWCRANIPMFAEMQRLRGVK